MRTLPLTIHRTCPGHSEKGILLQLILSLCTEGHRAPLWLWLLLLSVLCRFTWAYSASEIKDVEICLDKLSKSIQKSDAKLYAPSVDEIEAYCEKWSLSCYMLELEMVLIEEQIQGSATDCIFGFIASRTSTEAGKCLPCEATALRSSTTFLENLTNLLKKITAQLAHG